MKRVKVTCPYCGSGAHLQPAALVYGDRTNDPGVKLYVCDRYPVCDAYVSAHRQSLLPMGTLADKHLRRKRMEAHTAITRMAERRAMNKNQVYRWLQLQMGLPESEAHIGKFSELRCQEVIQLCRDFARGCSRAA